MAYPSEPAQISDALNHQLTSKGGEANPGLQSSVNKTQPPANQGEPGALLPCQSEVMAVKVLNVDFNPNCDNPWDGCPFSATPQWLKDAIETRQIEPVPDDRDYSPFRVRGNKCLAMPGDWIVRRPNGLLDIVKQASLHPILDAHDATIRATARREALEEAAKVVDKAALRCFGVGLDDSIKLLTEIASVIRALIDKPEEASNG